MRRCTTFIWYIGMAVAVICGGLGLAHGQKLVKYRTKDGNERQPTYRIGRMRQGAVNGVQTLLLQISVKPANFNRDDMIALAKELNRDFRDVKHLNVAICDDHSAAKDSLLIFNLLRHEADPALRGFYDLDRTTNKEGIDFSTKWGKPLNEVSIGLDRD